MTYRKLRIAWSVVWGLATVLLIVLWVRSFWYVDGANMPIGSYSIGLGTAPGALWVGWRSRSQWDAWNISHTATEQWRRAIKAVKPPIQPPSQLSGGIIRWRGSVVVQIPLWLLAPIFATFSIVPWLRWRFSLRTLLIATTLVAVVLGLIVWLSS